MTPDPSDDQQYVLFITHGYHNRGQPSWYDDTWVFWSKAKVWRKIEGDVETGPAGERPKDKPSARYGAVLGPSLSRSNAVVQLNRNVTSHAM